MTLSDSALINLARHGDTAAYASLWRRHLNSARWAASTIDPQSDVEDITQEVFTRLLAEIQSSPQEAFSGPFRQYVYVAVRQAIDATRTPHTVPLSLRPHDSYLPEFADQLSEKSLVVNAFSSLSHEWQTILWYTEVEQLSPAEVAPILGLSPNAVSALAYRAREGLRAAWLQAHVQSPSHSKECTWVLKHLGTYARGTLSPRKTSKVNNHLRGCEACTQTFTEVNSAAKQLRGIVLWTVLGLSQFLRPDDSLAQAGNETDGPNLFDSTRLADSALPAASAAGSTTGSIGIGVASTALGAVAASIALGVSFIITGELPQSAVATAVAPRTQDSSQTTADSKDHRSVQFAHGQFGQSAQFTADPGAPITQDLDNAAALRTTDAMPDSAGANESNSLDPDAQSPTSTSATASDQQPVKQNIDTVLADLNPAPSTVTQNSPDTAVEPPAAVNKDRGPDVTSSSSASDTSPSSSAKEPTSSETKKPSTPSSSPSSQKPTSKPSTSPTSKPSSSPSTPKATPSAPVPANFSAIHVNKGGSGAPIFSGNGVESGVVEIYDERNVLVGRVRIGMDGNWGLTVDDTFSQDGLTSMTYAFYLTPPDGKRQFVKSLTVTGLS